MSDKGSRDELKGRASGAGATSPAARLCYVDDSRTSAYVVRRLLQPYGYQVDYFQSAEPAFVALIQEDYDLLLTDLKVSSKGMDGDDLIRTLRQSGHPKLSSLPVIVITGTTDARVLVDVYDAGANQVMNKPVNAEELDGHIRRLLPESKPELRVVEQQHDRDNVVSLSAAQRPVQKQSESTDNTNPSSTPAPSPQQENKTPSSEAKKSEADIPVLDAAPPVQSPPIQADATPVQADVPPVQADVTPVQVDVTSIQADATPVQADVTPVQVDVTSIEADVPPVQADVAPAQVDATPVQADVTPVQADTPSVQADTPPVQADVTPVQVDVPPVQVDVTPIQADAPPAQVDVTPIQADAPPVQADVTLIQADAPQENDDTTQTNNLSDQNPELVSDPVNHEKESLLERAVLKQEELKEKQNNVEVGNNHQETGEENIKTEEIVQDVEKPVDDEILKDEVIVDPYESISGDDVSIEIPAENENILHEMDKHALVVRERTGLLSDSNILGAFGSLVELVGVRNLIKRIVVAGFGIFIVLMAWNILFDQGQPVETTLVETGEIFQSITVPGRVLSKQRVNISSAHTGRTVKILVKEGDKVKAGQVLAKMDDRELISSHNRAKANLTDARESVVLARRTLSRLRKAYKKGAVARQFVEDAELDLSSARSQAGIAVEEAHSAKLQLSKQQVTAPFTGTITARFAEVGQWVGPSESLFTLVDESRREIEVRVDAADSVAIDVGQVVAVSSDAFPGLEWHESVSRLGTAANNDRNSNSVKVYISLGNDAPSLRFGQQVDADIRTAWNPNTLKVPFEALINRDGQTLVAVLSGGQVKLKPVETGIEDFSMVEIKQGLNDGELVILSKGQFLQNGDKAHPVRNSR